jgi:hypothetical protein
MHLSPKPLDNCLTLQKNSVVQDFAFAQMLETVSKAKRATGWYYQDITCTLKKKVEEILSQTTPGFRI